MRALLAIALAGCSSPPPIERCADSLAGTWRPEGADGGGEWMLLDHGRTVEGYPLFDDSRPAGGDAGLEVAPRAIDLARAGDRLEGEVSRRYMRGSERCVVKVPLHVLACTGATLELVLSDPSPPLQFAPCAESSRKNPSRRERWLRVHR